MIKLFNMDGYNKVAANEWISVDRDFLPPYGLPVIICYDMEYVGQGIRTHTDKFGEHWTLSDLSMIATIPDKKVTHWQLFPKPVLTGEYPAVLVSSKNGRKIFEVTDIDFCKKNCAEYGNCQNLMEDQSKMVATCEWSKD
jgi:hypothetical protein